MPEAMTERVAKIITALIFAGAILIVNFWLRETKELLWLVVIFTLFFYGHALGRACFPKQDWKISILPGIILFLALQSIFQTAWYYLDGKLGIPSDVVSLIAAIVVATVLSRRVPIWHIESSETRNLEPETCSPEPLTNGSRLILYTRLLCATALTGASFLTLLLIMRRAGQAATMESISTPWPLLPEYALALIALIWLALIAIIFFTRHSLAAALTSACAIFSLTCIPALVYKIGYGFDGFLHIASEKILLTSGTLSPKPFYYIGQYVFTTWFSRLADIPVAAIDRWLVPVGVALLLPLTILLIGGFNPRYGSARFLILGLLPLSAFASTTPQNFAYLLGLCALFLSVDRARQNISPIVPIILLLWAIAVHPLAGLPLLLVAAALILSTYERKTSQILSWVCVCLAGVAVPAMFYILGLHGNLSLIWNLKMMFSPGTWLTWLKDFTPWIGNRTVVWPAWTSLTAKILPFILFITALFGSNLPTRTGEVTSPLQTTHYPLLTTHSSNRRISYLLITAAIILMASSAVLKNISDFSFLIDYERGNYADRLNALAIFCLLPAAMLGLMNFWPRIKHAPKILSAGIMIFFLGLATALAYDSLPRHDALVAGRGWSTSFDDFDVVKLIDHDAENRNYTVLANQSVSAAAVAELGFKRYAQDIFFYPIPTGGALYQKFLDISYNEPTLDIIKDTAQLGQSDLVYVVINDYWWRADAIASAIGKIADQKWEIGDSKVKVYKFDLSIDSSSSTTVSTP